MSKVCVGTDAARRILFETNKNVFLAGPAGTGKTTLIREFTQANPGSIVCAPTGVAAVNAGGVTMHSLFGIPVPCTGERITSKQDQAVKVISAASCIIIDEISMARSDAFSFAMRVLKKAEAKKGSKIRLIVVGDFYQLPPVVPKFEVARLKKAGLHESGLPFTTKEWQAANLQVCVLDKIYRQDEPEFLSHLWEARNANDECLEYFNSFITDEFPENAIRVCGTNQEADDVNAKYLNSLPGMPTAYTARKKGRCTGSGIDEVVLLKEGARVMITVNDPGRMRFANGSFGVVLHMDPEFVDVDLDDGGIVRLGYTEHQLYSYSSKGGELVKKEAGTIAQVPLKIAAAITIHKSQGKTFDAMVLDPTIFAPGQLYVALSRVKSPSGLFLSRPIEEGALSIDETVKTFVDNGYTFDIPKAKVSEKKKVAEKKTENEKTSKKKQQTIKKPTKTAKKATKTKASKNKTSASNSTKITAKKTATKNKTKSSKNTKTTKPTRSSKTVASAKKTTVKKTKSTKK